MAKDMQTDAHQEIRRREEGNQETWGGGRIKWMKKDFGPTSLIQHEAHAVGPPINRKENRSIQKEREALQKEVNSMEELGIIRNAWNTSILIVPKPDGSPRFCMDFHQLNKQTTKFTQNIEE
jgi:hypothetical protein